MVDVAQLARADQLAVRERADREDHDVRPAADALEPGDVVALVDGRVAGVEEHLLAVVDPFEQALAVGVAHGRQFDVLAAEQPGRLGGVAHDRTEEVERPLGDPAETDHRDSGRTDPRTTTHG